MQIVEWTPDPRELADLELLLSGAYEPLTGFLGHDDLHTVHERGTLADGTPWPAPVTLHVHADLSPRRRGHPPRSRGAAAGGAHRDRPRARRADLGPGQGARHARARPVLPAAAHAGPGQGGARRAARAGRHDAGGRSTTCRRWRPPPRSSTR
ncbi:hypothetical protein [Nonomuraea salmonea]|uniref:hypothetical protein n=1 Tax=Nonomuraea salmonea TaxID=46181 RepID=UPI003CD076D2